MKAENIDYIAMEGGGGKGIVYLGAIRALEMKGKLPLDKNSKTNNANSLKGMGGSSAGAITTYILALGTHCDGTISLYVSKTGLNTCPWTQCI